MAYCSMLIKTTAMVFGAVLLSVTSGISTACAATGQMSAAIPPHSNYRISPDNTAWEPEANSARLGNHGWPGGATFSITGGGSSGEVDLSEIHGPFETQPITDLGLPGYSFGRYILDIDWALDRWSAVSGFTNLGYVADSNLGDIRVAAWEIVTPTVLAMTFSPDTELLSAENGPLGGDIHIDVDRIWINDPDHQRDRKKYDFRTILLHEVGHALGLGHSSESGAVMLSSYNGARRELTADDIAGIQFLYGGPTEEDLNPPIGRIDLAIAVGAITNLTGDGPAAGDWNTDGIVTLADFATLQARFGEPRMTIGSSQPVPEPNALILLVIGLMSFGFVRFGRRANGSFNGKPQATVFCRLACFCPRSAGQYTNEAKEHSNANRGHVDDDLVTSK